MGGIRKITRDVYSIPLAGSLPGTLNTYILRGDPTILIDGGPLGCASPVRIEAALRTLRLTLGDVDFLLPTDCTPERAGLAGPSFLQPSMRPTLHPSAGKAQSSGEKIMRNVGRELAACVLDHPRLELSHPHEDVAQVVLRAYQAAHAWTLHVPPAEIGLSGGRRLHVLPAPGTSATHVAYWLEPDGILFAGDLSAVAGEPPLLLRSGGGLAALAQTVASLRALRPRNVLPLSGNPLSAVESFESLWTSISRQRSMVRAWRAAQRGDLASLVAAAELGRVRSPLLTARRASTLRLLAANEAWRHAQASPHSWDESAVRHPATSRAASHIARDIWR